MDGDASFEQLKQTVLDALKQSEFKNNIKVSYSEYVYASNTENDLSLEGRVPKSKENELVEFREGLYDLLAEKVGSEKATQFLNDNFQVEIGLSEGDQFAPIQASDLNGNSVTIAHESGKVLMVDFWATWCGYCQDPMQENVDLMTKNPELRSNVSIVGLSCDEEVPSWKEHVISRGWDAITQYVRPNCLKEFGIRGIPCIAIVNKAGRVAYVGHPGSIKLHETLSSIAADGKVVLAGEEVGEESSKNVFWFDMDAQSKSVLVAECDFTLKEAGITNSSMLVSTKYELNTETWELKPIQATPIFYGVASQFEYDNLQTAAITIQTNYNLNGFKFRVRVVDVGGDEDF